MVTDDASDGTPRGIRGNFLTTTDINVDVFSSSFKQMEATGRKLAWIDDRWAVDFGRKWIWIDAHKDNSAAEFVREVLDLLAGPDAGLQGYDRTSAAYYAAHPEVLGLAPGDRAPNYAANLNRAKKEAREWLPLVEGEYIHGPLMMGVTGGFGGRGNFGSIEKAVTRFGKQKLGQQVDEYKILLKTYQRHLKKYKQSPGRTTGETNRIERQLQEYRSILEGRGRQFGQGGDIIE